MTRTLAGTSVRDALDGAVTAITAGGSDTPRLDAELLLAHTLGVARERLHADPGLVVAGDAVRTFQGFVRRRAIDREPVAYLLGRRAFRFVELAVGPAVLVPRPETELLVEFALALPPGARVLDVGTGSGAIALALASERPDLTVCGSDVSAAALALATANATRLGLSVEWCLADLLDGLDTGWDVVLANLPYIPTAELALLQPEVSTHEPVLALDGGPDGLEVIRRLVVQLSASAVDLVAMEVGAGQAQQVAELLLRSGYPDVSRRSDLAGIERIVIARR
jgi:release factor glutamine methyltransferase